ncbi:MAG TPA: sigma factor [Verrucomicrobiae bacterium]|jgi:RNA polymerase sigma-70 factor (ECF subfamily)
MDPQPTPAVRDRNGPNTESHSAFATTLWATVFTARSNDKESARNALERLCRIYWPPIYSFVRRRGATSHDAEDMTQAFFSQLVERETIKRAERAKGKFRTFLLAALTNFLSDEWDKQQRLKRGGECQIIPLTDMEMDRVPEFADNLSVEKVFDRQWALALIEHVTSLMEREFFTAGKSTLFQALQPMLVHEMAGPKCCEVAAALHMNESAVKVSLHRLRRRFGEIVREEIGHTVSSPGEIDEEIRHLFAAMSL